MNSQRKKEKDYNKGRYIVNGPSGEQIGLLDNSEHVVGLNGRLLYRIDGDEVYTIEKREGSVEFLGYIEEDEARCVKDYSHLYFTLIEDEE